MGGEPTHERLHREGFERRARRARSEEDLAEWKKHTYRPDVSRSQASGPRVVRQYSGVGFESQDHTPRGEEENYGADADELMMEVMGTTVAAAPAPEASAAAYANEPGSFLSPPTQWTEEMIEQQADETNRFEVVGGAAGAVTVAYGEPVHHLVPNASDVDAAGMLSDVIADELGNAIPEQAYRPISVGGLQEQQLGSNRAPTVVTAQRSPQNYAVAADSETDRLRLAGRVVSHAANGTSGVVGARVAPQSATGELASAAGFIHGSSRTRVAAESAAPLVTIPISKSTDQVSPREARIVPVQRQVSSPTAQAIQAPAVAPARAYSGPVTGMYSPRGTEFAPVTSGCSGTYAQGCSGTYAAGCSGTYSPRGPAPVQMAMPPSVVAGPISSPRVPIALGHAPVVRQISGPTVQTVQYHTPPRPLGSTVVGTSSSPSLLPAQHWPAQPVGSHLTIGQASAAQPWAVQSAPRITYSARVM